MNCLAKVAEEKQNVKCKTYDPAMGLFELCQAKRALSIILTKMYICVFS